MQEQSNEDLTNKQNEKKNQKNIYVHKIKSLMRISQDSLLQDEKEITVALNKKHIKKVRSEVDKTAIKLEKNRESAKRARLRKKLYIKLLEDRVDKLKSAADEGQRIQNECLKFSQMICKKEGNSSKVEREWDETENYLEEGNHHEHYKRWKEREESFAKMDKLVQQVCQISTCSSLRNIRELSSQISLEEIIRAEQEKERQQQGEQLQEIIKEVLVETESLRSIYIDLMSQNESIKKLVMQTKVPPQLSSSPEDPAVKTQDLPQLISSQFSSFYERSHRPQSIFINLAEGERIMIEGWSYLEQKLNAQADL